MSNLNRTYKDPQLLHFVNELMRIAQLKEYAPTTKLEITKLHNLLIAMTDDQIKEIAQEVACYECGWNPADGLIYRIEQRIGSIPYPDDM